MAKVEASLLMSLGASSKIFHIPLLPPQSTHSSPNCHALDSFPFPSSNEFVNSETIESIFSGWKQIVRVGRGDFGKVYIRALTKASNEILSSNLI